MNSAPLSAVFFGGRFVPQDEARVHVTDRGYLLGEGVFETLRGYDGVCFRAEQHLETLARGAAMFGMSLPFSVAKLVEIADEAAARTSATNAYVRVTLTRGAGSDGDPGVLTVLSRPLETPSEADYANGVRATFVSARRIPPACMDPTVKTTSYAAQVLARREAVSRGIGEGEGIMLAIDGSLACATMANLFVVRGDVLLTPPITTGCRAGVTRGAVLELAHARFTVREETLAPAALFDADEAFFTSTRVECLPIASIDGKSVASLHPRTSELHAELRARIATENHATRTLPRAGR